MTHNPIRPWRNIERRKSRQIMVGNVPVGGDAPITVQTMTNTLTTDVAATIAQIQAAAEAGADIVRVSVPDEASSRAMREIVRESPVPLVADIHFHYKRGIEAAEAGAACLRINPGNIGDAARVREVIAAARGLAWCIWPVSRTIRRAMRAWSTTLSNWWKSVRRNWMRLRRRRRPNRAAAE